MSHQLRQFTSNYNNKVCKKFDSSISTSTHKKSLKNHQSQGSIDLKSHNKPSTSIPAPEPAPAPATTVVVVDNDPTTYSLLFRRDLSETRPVFDVSCSFFSTLAKRLCKSRQKQVNIIDPIVPSMAISTDNNDKNGNKNYGGDELNHQQMREGKKNYGGEQKKEELQREVSVLKTMLRHEENIREIMQKAYNRKPGMEITLPNHLPPKVKEVLDELVMVEDEITRLEIQIDKIQKDAKNEHEELTTTLSLQNKSTITSNGVQHGTSYDNKTLHFIISKPERGVTTSNGKIGIPSMTRGNPSTYFENHKGKRVEDAVIAKRNMVLKGSTSPLREFICAPESPLRDFRHPTPKPQERSTTTQVRSDHPKKALTTSNGTKCQPNKLSENIMKTLILLYIRLIRTSRQNELEKSSPTSRSSFISFRNDLGTTMNLSSSMVVVQKDYSKQQDPYGVFDIEGAIKRDIGPYKNLVVFSSSSLDPKFVSHHSSIPLFAKLRDLLNSLQKVDLQSMSDQQKLAFWINIYNACIMHAYLKYGVPCSQDKLLTFLNKATLTVGGKVVNAKAIEHCILRTQIQSTTNQGEMDSKEAIIHEQYGFGSVYSNIIFALSCGTRSSPAVRVYTAEGVTTELEKSKLEYLQASISITNKNKNILLSELLIQNMHDFANDLDSLIQWVCQQLPTSCSLRKSIVDSLKGHNNNNNNNNNNIDKIPFDFEFQYLLQV